MASADAAVAAGVNPAANRHTLPIAGPVTQVFAAVTSASLQHAPGALDMRQHGFCDAVVWNPGPEADIPDLPADGYCHFVCVESALIERPLLLAGGEHWHGSQCLQVRGT